MRIFHPAIAVAAAVVVLLISLKLLQTRPAAETFRFAVWTSGLILLQILAGALNVLLLAPILLQVVHLLLADLVWISLVLLGASALAVPEEKTPVRMPAVARA